MDIGGGEDEDTKSEGMNDNEDIGDERTDVGTAA